MIEYRRACDVPPNLKTKCQWKLGGRKLKSNATPEAALRIRYKPHQTSFLYRIEETEVENEWQTE